MALDPSAWSAPSFSMHRIKTSRRQNPWLRADPKPRIDALSIATSVINAVDEGAGLESSLTRICRDRRNKHRLDTLNTILAHTRDLLRLLDWTAQLVQDGAGRGRAQGDALDRLEALLPDIRSYFARLLELVHPLDKSNDKDALALPWQSLIDRLHSLNDEFLDQRYADRSN